MSGAEGILVLGLVSSICTIFEAAYHVYSAAHDTKGLPKAFRTTAEQIPLVLHALQLVEKGVAGKDDFDQAVVTVKPILERCKKKAALVKNVFDKALPAKDAPRWERYKKALEAKLKDREIKSSMEAITQDLALLQHQQTFQDAETMKDIKAAIHHLDESMTTDGDCMRRSGLFLVPHSVNRLFTGRQDVLDRLQTQIEAGVSRRNKQTRIALTGLAGIGKSEICLKLADMVRERFGHIFWVDVGEYQAAEQAFMSIARRLKEHAQNLEEALHVLGIISQTWLLILDNADDLTVDYSQFFPPGSGGIVVMTSRNFDCGWAYGCDHWEQLESLDQPDATSLLLQAANIAESLSMRTAAEKVVQTLGNHTLAIILAGSYIARGHCGLEQYQGVYESHWRRAMSYSKLQEKPRYGSVLATFETSMSILETEQSQTKSDALDLLRMLGASASAPVPMSLFLQAQQGATNVSCSDGPGDIELLSRWHISTAPSFLDLSSNECDLYRTIEAGSLLQSLSLVTLSDMGDERKMSMHPLIHDWVWRRQQHQEMENAWTIAGSVLSLSLYPPAISRASEEELGLHIQHLVTVRKDYDLLPSPNHPQLQVLFRCADALDDRRVDDLALETLNEIARQLGADGEALGKDYIGLYKLWARSFLRNGDLWSGVTVWEHVVSLEQDLHQSHPSRLESEHRLAVAYGSDGKIEKAVQLLEHVVAVRTNKLLENDLRLLSSQHELARMYEASRQDAKAVSLLEHVVRIEDSVLAEDHRDRLASQHALASAYEANNQTGKAIKLLEHVVQVRESKLAEAHPDRLASRHELARAYESDGQIEKALDLLEHVVKMRERLPESHPERLASQHVLGRVYKRSGLVDRAIDLLEHVVKVRTRTVGEEHPARKASEYELARAYEAKSGNAGSCVQA